MVDLLYPPAPTAIASPLFVGLNGHSYSQGSGAESDHDGYAERYAKTIGARRWDKRGINGAILCWARVGGQGDGGWAYAVNAIRQGYTLMQSTGPWQQSTNQSWDHYGARSTVEVMGWGINDLAQLGSNNLTPFLNALRAVMSVACAGKIIVAANTNTFTLSGTFANDTHGTGWQNYGNILKRTTTVGNTITMAVPSDMPSGRTLGFMLVTNPTDIYTCTISQNGTVIGTYNLSGATNTDPNHTGATNPANIFPIRIGKPGDGITINPGDSLVLTLTAVTSGGMGLTAVTIEANPADGPIIHILQPNMPAAYTLWNSYPFGPSAGTNPMNNASVTAMKNAILAGPAIEFGHRVVVTDVDPILNASTDFWTDSAHPNPLGHGKIARQMALDLAKSGLLTTALCAGSTNIPSQFWLPLNIFHIVDSAMPSSVQLQNSWTAFDAAGGNTSGIQFPLYPGFRRDETGQVFLRGRVSGGASGTILCTLYQGYWPSNDQYLPITGLDSAGNIATGMAKVGAGTGVVTLTYTTTSGTLSWLSLDGIKFQAEL